MKLNIEELAKQADPDHGGGGFASDSIVGKAAITEFARLIVERCAVVCETPGIGARFQGDVYAEAIRKLLEAE